VAPPLMIEEGASHGARGFRQKKLGGAL